MKVALINNLYSPNIRGGAELSVQLLAEALASRGIETIVVTTAEQATQPVVVGGVKVLTLVVPNVHWAFGAAPAPPMRRKLWHLIDVYNPGVTRELTRLLRSERPDIVHTNNLQGISVSAWRAAALAGVPVVHTLRDYYLACARSMCFRDGRNCSGTCLECLPFCVVRRRLSANVAGVVGTSRFILEHHLGLGFFNGAGVRRAIDNPCPPTMPGRRANDVVKFGYLGRLEPAKGVEALLSAFCDREDDGWELMIAGVGSAEFDSQLRRRAKSARRPQRIRLMGWVDAADFLSRIDVLVAPSLWHEPLARAVIEAQAHGRAVIASRRGGLTEMIEDGIDGFLIEPDEPVSLRKAIERLIRDRQLVRRMGDAALARARRYEPDEVARQYAAAYEEVIGGRSP